MKIKKEKVEKLDLVWAQMRYCPFWPARVVETPPILGPTPPNKVCVLFFGTKQFGFVGNDKKHLVSYTDNRGKLIKKGRGNDFRTAVKEMDEYISDNVKFRAYACVNPVKTNIVVKTEKTIEQQLGIKAEKAYQAQANGNVLQIESTWEKEKQTLIEKVVSLKTENQTITQTLNEKQNELNILTKTKQTLEKHMSDKEKEFSSKSVDLKSQLSKYTKIVESQQKDIASLKREKQTLLSQIKQLQSTLAEKEDDSTSENDVFEVESILNDTVVTEKTHYYLVHWKNYDSSHDSWECESNLNCPNILKKYKQSKNKF